MSLSQNSINFLTPFFYYRACQCAGFSDGEGVETLWSSLDPTATPTRVNEPSARHEALNDHRNLWTECREHGELAPAFDWAFQCPLHMYIDNLEDDDDDEMPGLMSQDESDSFKTNRVRGFKPRNLSKL
ncbi:hypothetical protein B0H11DRAFT_1905417 [Mycena galericulata]|nr:hypothetical protein B0H11DRAFT_1905417 [Mycena galericulata]